MRFALFCLLMLCIVPVVQAQESWMPYDPGPVSASASQAKVKIGNKALSLAYDGKIVTLRSWNGKDYSFTGGLFDLSFTSGYAPFAPPTTVEAPRITKIDPTNSLRKATHFAGREISTTAGDAGTGLHIRTRWIMLDHTNYIRMEVTLTATTQDVDLNGIKFFDWELPGAKVVGTVSGSPISSGKFFVGLEHPMSVSTVKGNIATCVLVRKLPLKKGQSVTYSGVIGAEAPGQARRSFASYVDMERARPYQPFLHYNSWYDLGYFNRYVEKDCVDRINAFGQELVKKRGVKLSSFLFDDGWDDTSTNWEFHDGFPNGFTPLKEAAAQYGAAPGVWLSPWGGYGKPREERLATGRKNGYEIDSEGFALSGPKYFDLFSKICLRMVNKYGINQFKFDGTGSPDKQYPGSKFDSDFDAAIQLINQLRQANPKLFVNLTTGTWPSPFWTRFADSTWRGGSDHDFTGVGPDRQRWITYRDSDTYHEVVKRGPFYPLNSLMLHGLIYARYADKLATDPTNAFRDEIRSYFGNGTQLQEMYITPSLLTKQNWDDLAQAAKWSAANASILKDSHWIGGDPEKLEVYGWASWSPKKSIIVLRNPSDKAQAIAIEPGEMLQFPANYKKTLRFSPAFGERSPSSFAITPTSAKAVTLAPFQVMVLEGLAG